jgi:opacity protein-like surface antigen
MKRILLVSIIAALALTATPVQAAPNPNCCSDPYNQFVATRILPNGNEVTLAVYSLEAGYTTDQAIRATVLAFVRQERINNPAWVIVIYGPIDPPSTFYTNGDRVWDSRTDL